MPIASLKRQFLNNFNDYKELLRLMLTPDEICDAVEDINLDDLYGRGFRTILLDLDNTLMTYEQKELSLQKYNWVERLKIQGFRVFIISNNSSKRRVQRVAKQLMIDGLYFSTKPLVFGAKELAERQMIDFERTIVVGDQVLTDVIFGNWLRAHTVLIEPLNKRLSFIKTLQREVELFLLRNLD
ncbi:MAG: YqeG family HAD IIIA-type phosphatase [bacterium]|nr:YqeG family HAD IIIA-type phosphatase [bacterium]